MTKKILFFIVVSLLFVSGAISQEIKVCQSCEYKTVAEAVAKAKPYTKIVIEQGTYKESNIRIDKPLILEGRNYPVLDANNNGYVLMVEADSVTVKGLTLKNPGQSYTKDYAAVYVSKSDYFTAENNTLENVFFGFLLEKSQFGRIVGNVVSGEAVDEASSGNGIHLWHCGNAHIENNELFNLRDGIYFEFVSKSVIVGNNSHNNIRYGLHFMFSNNDEYHDNVFTNNGAGVAVMFSKFINMAGNTFNRNWGMASYGLLLKEIYDAEIEGNKFIENTIGINVEGSTRINYNKNDFSNNGWALKIIGACYNNVFKQNNFSNNSFDLSYNSKINNNTFDGNYWSSYTGYDLDKDGIGDVPYRPVKLFSYIVNKTPEALILLRSLFVNIINFSEKVSPIFTPDELKDNRPHMKPIP
ncbi:MAG: nitrous oxide reductase [Flavobacteriia bacterium]|nr:MAG: nitrous oxide reductase [Flavobacteriia bacterium]